MSKSLGNITAPQKVINEFGADILRLWVVGSDYYDDLRIGKEILIRHSDHYRRLRNTLRYLLGALNGFEDDEKITFSKMPELEKWVLHRVSELSKKIEENTEQFNLHDIYLDIHNFCTVDLSAFYFDIRKDTLYCEDLKGIERRSCRTVMDILFKSLTTWLAPIICFTAEEAWQSRYNDQENSVHLQTYFKTKEDWQKYFDGIKDIDLECKPDVSFLPPMFRRKLSPLNRMIFCTSNLLSCETSFNNIPFVFSSRHGELDLSLKLINSILQKNPMSPAGFSMSVHNSPAGLYSIHNKNTQATTAIAAAEDSLKMAFIEAQAQLLANPMVLLCYADTPMPDVYKCFSDNIAYPQFSAWPAREFKTFPVCLTIIPPTIRCGKTIAISHFKSLIKITRPGI